MFSVQQLNKAFCFICKPGRLLVFVFTYCCYQVNGQTKVPCNEITEEMGFTVKSVRIKGRWVPESLKAEVERTVGLGQTFNPVGMSQAIELVRDEIIKGENTLAIRLVGSTSVLYVDADVCDISDPDHARQAEVVIQAYYLRIDLYNLGRNILPVPRSARPTFFTDVPSLLLLTSPVLGFQNDRQFGPSLSLQTSTNLLQVSGVKKADGAKSKSLNLELDARKSLNNPFQTIALNLDFVQPVFTGRKTGWNIGIRYGHIRYPLADGRNESELFRVYGSIRGSTRTSFAEKYTFGASARFLENQFNTGVARYFENPENGYEFFTVADGRLGKGFSRIGIWFDAGVPKKTAALKSYQRLAGRIGYGVTIGSGHRNMDVEAIIGSGYAWRTPPAYNQFFAGNSYWNFLYEPLMSMNNRIHPYGPVVRSLGEREGALPSSAGNPSGGNSYWHLNLNFSIPISTWSRPLIPDIVISEEPRRTTLRSALKAQVRTAKNFILNDLIDTQGLPDDEETEALADGIVDRDIRPTINYLADRSNLYSIKPLLLFDIAQISDRLLDNKLWTAAGIGIQVNIVVARFEMGYMRTLSSPDSGKDNLFVRFTLQNFY
jgi:hypothetical protein